MMDLEKVTRRSRKPSSIPTDVIDMQILHRLPVKSLCRFKSVSKHWHSLISSYDFVRKHLKYHQTYKTNNVPSFCFGTKISYNDVAPNVFSFKVYKLETKYEPDDEIPVFNLEFKSFNHGYQPYKFPMDKELIGACNGLLCLQVLDKDYIDARHGRPVCFLIWNPCIGIERAVNGPFVPFQSKILSSGFGFVPSTDDYKIVFLEQSLGTRNVVGRLYSLKRGRWTNLSIGNTLWLPGDRLFSYSYRVPPLILVKETLYWLCPNDDKDLRLLALDLKTQTLSSVPFPDEVHKPVVGNRTLFLCKFEECVCVCWMHQKLDTQNFGFEKGMVDLKVWRLCEVDLSWNLSYDFRNLNVSLWEIHWCLAFQTWFTQPDRDKGDEMLCLGVCLNELISVGVIGGEAVFYKVKYTGIAMQVNDLRSLCAFKYVESLLSPFYNVQRARIKRKAKVDYK